MRRIVIIEDDPDLLDALMREFRHSGFEVFGARDGVEGMEMALQYQPQVILLDLLLPQLEGLDMLKNLRRYDWGKAVTVIVLTNFDDPSHISEANELGVRDYLVKANYSLAEIVERVKQAL